MQYNLYRAVAFSLAALAIHGCSSNPSAMTELRVQKEPLPSFIDPPVIPNIEIKLEEHEWWKLAGYEPQPILIPRHGWFHGPRCLPPFRIIATLATPKSDSFVREDIQAQREHEKLLVETTGVRVVRMDFTPISLDELEKAFLDDALPRLKGTNDLDRGPRQCYQVLH